MGFRKESPHGVCIRIIFEKDQAKKAIELLGFVATLDDMFPMEIHVPTQQLVDTTDANQIILYFDRDFEESQEGYTRVMDFLERFQNEYYLSTERELSIKIKADDYDQVAFIKRRADVLTNAMDAIWKKVPEWKQHTPKFNNLRKALFNFYHAVNFDRQLYSLSDEAYERSPVKRMIDMTVQMIDKIFDSSALDEKIKFFKDCQNDAKIKSLSLSDPFVQLFKLVLVTTAAYFGFTYFIPTYKTVSLSLTLFTMIGAGHYINLPNKLGESSVNIAKAAIELGPINVNPVHRI